MISAAVALVGSLIFVRYQIKDRKKLQQKTLSMEAMRLLWSDRLLEDDIRKVLKVSDISQYAQKRGKTHACDKQWEETRNRIVRIINYYEMLSVGIHEGIYDRNIIKRYNKSQIIKLFNLTRPFIEKIREEYNNQSLAMEFEKFARSLENSD
ncbi:MAG: DUF4760 domain-containing protein [Gammaproteobacteria bacterium]|nr:DUF4760 domain-containing protein [Gammaproteobacteria bacterium]